jgi:hypothetical protein
MPAPCGSVEHAARAARHTRILDVRLLHVLLGTLASETFFFHS